MSRAGVSASNPQPVDESMVKKIIEQGLMPMLCGATMGQVTQATSSRSVTGSNSRSLCIRPGPSYPRTFLLERNQVFSPAETKLAKAFMDELESILPSHDHAYFSDLVTASARRAIVRSLEYPQPELLLRVIDEFDRLSAQTYEGQRISAAIGLNDINRDSGVTIADAWKEDFSKVLTSGVDTMLTVCPNGTLYQFEAIEKSDKVPWAPYHLRLIADWTTNARLGVVLNRNGEILIFRDKRLCFARRRGHWVRLVHEPIIQQMGRIGTPELRGAVYETCLDVSFARTGGCIAIVKSSAASRLRNANREERPFISSDDLLAGERSCKSRSINWLVNRSGRFPVSKFQNLPRRFRQELAAIDGATVLDHTGEILAAGAIVRSDGGSDAGARKAAARALSRYGLGIKISADGEVVGFSNDEGLPDKILQPLFRFA